jgi:hypothetical protein
MKILGSSRKEDFGGARLELTYHESINRVCKPGGWLQFVEPYHNIQSDNGTLTDDHAIRQVSTLFARAIGEKKDIRVPMRMGEMMRNAGLVSVSAHMIQVPLNDWPAGMYNHRNGLWSALSLGIFPGTNHIKPPRLCRQLYGSATDKHAEHLLTLNEICRSPKQRNRHEVQPTV